MEVRHESEMKTGPTPIVRLTLEHVMNPAKHDPAPEMIDVSNECQMLNWCPPRNRFSVSAKQDGKALIVQLEMVILHVLKYTLTLLKIA